MSLLFLQVDTATGKQRAVASPSGTWEQEVPTGTVNGVNTVFTLSLEPLAAGSTFVYLDSLLIPNTDYVLNLIAKTVTFTVAPASGQKPYVVYIR